MRAEFASAGMGMRTRSTNRWRLELSVRQGRYVSREGLSAIGRVGVRSGFVGGPQLFARCGASRIAWTCCRAIGYVRVAT